MTNAMSWQSVCSAFTQDNGTLNIAQVALDRQVEIGRGDVTAIKFLRKDGSVQQSTFVALRDAAARFASALQAHQVERGDRIFSLLGRVPELYVSALGALRGGAVFTPLFSVFGPEPIRTRMEIGRANVLVTTAGLYRRKIAPWRESLPSLRIVIIVDGDADATPTGTVHFTRFMQAGTQEHSCAPTTKDDLALVHFTSGTTGKPKGVMHVQESVVAHHVSAALALDLRPDDIYWCTADPGWVTGTSYGIIAPLTHGVTMIVDEADFDPRRWYEILARERVNVWYTAPTAIRMLMKAGLDVVRERDYPSLRFMASVGEPLNPEAVVWGEQAFGQPFHDNWWQTETGSIMIANRPGMAVKPGAMGKALPEIDAAVVVPGDPNHVLTDPDEVGELALRKGWPSMMRGYLDEQTRYEKCFVGDWYLTGDLVRRDVDGYFWFVSRADDVIQSAGHLISPFEVESALVAHPAVVEAAVVGLPDETIGEVVAAFVSIGPDDVWNRDLQRDIMAHARKRLGPSVAPRSIENAPLLPRTRSGKIMRRVVKARAMGLPEGDTSTLETTEGNT